jgi:drug/metabolite transporter (DMT)-like permease
MVHHSPSPRQYLILSLVALCAPLGNACLAKGMTSLPALSVTHPMALIMAVFTPWVAMGIVLLIGFFASYLTALSWADLSYVMLATAWGNVVVELLSRFALHEAVSPQRWLGVLLIAAGVGYVTPGASRTVAPSAEASKSEVLK